MENINMSLVISIISAVLSFACLMYVVWKQAYEVLLPRDWLSNLRFIIFVLLVISAIGMLPVIVYQSFRLFGIDSEALRSVASVVGNFSRLASAILLVLIYNYKKVE